uniref:Putative cf-9 protein n=2 Tax=Brassica napus TaxID=3708 RepID=I7CDE1_BRANA|nr:putative cf-9 protein precursor [Brassica napus]
MRVVDTRRYQKGEKSYEENNNKPEKKLEKRTKTKRRKRNLWWGETVYSLIRRACKLCSSQFPFSCVKNMKGSVKSFSLIPISFCFLFLFRDEFAVPARHLCHPQQREAILEFKNEFQIQKPCSGWTVSWVNNSDCCSWDGIACDATFGDVIELNLGGNCIHGELNSKNTILKLQSLPFLETLNLAGNYFSGNIPSSLGNLSKLTTLDLSDNAFNGEIPSSLGKLYNLTILNLSHNKLIGKIPSSFGRLKHLTGLYAADNELSGNFPVTTLLNLTKLLSLSLYDNQFTGMLPPNISSLSNLVAFYIRGNALTGTLPSSLFSIPSLLYVTLEGNQLNGTLDFGNVSSSSKLMQLRLGNNNFLGSIPRAISKLVNLATLDLSHLNTQGLALDLSILWNLKSLEELDISDLNTTTAIDLNAILSRYKWLDKLNLTGNHVTYEKRSSVSDPPLLSELYLSGCRFTTGFPELLRTQHNMRTLDISNNKIKGQVPGWLWELSTLEYLNISNNTFTSFENPKKLRQPSSLEYLFGANNNFTGRIPSFICELRSLTVLDLSSNKFNGSLPRCIGKFSSVLEALNLRQNRLSGRLPKIIFRSLTSFDIGHNKLVGKLPRSLIANSSLEVLNVESNRFNDTFPSWLSSLPELQVLVLRSNAFHGPVHQTRFSKLRIIDISHNRFSGMLPSNFFLNWTAMHSIGKDGDQSNGNYMGTYYYFDSMVLMNKGVEMELVRILTIYTALDFSENEFEGVIPSSIGLLKELHVLNLSGNAFTGRIPSSMGNLSSLESLDLSRNKLTGAIPQELGNLSYLAYMNFSHNQLVGLVPGGTQFRTQPCSSFKDNPGLFGPSLEEVCVDHIHGKTSQPSEMSKEEEDGQEEVISWIAAAIGFIPGIVFGFTMGYIMVSYKPEWFINLFGRTKRRRISTTRR